MKQKKEKKEWQLERVYEGKITQEEAVRQILKVYMEGEKKCAGQTGTFSAS